VHLLNSLTYLYSELFGLADCYPRGTLGPVRRVQMLPPLGTAEITDILTSHTKPMCSETDFRYSTSSNVSIQNSRIRMEAVGRRFYFFALDGNGKTYRTEYCIMEIFGVQRYKQMPEVVSGESDITEFSSVEFLNSLTARFNASLEPAGTLSMTFDFGRNEYDTLAPAISPILAR